MKHHLYTGCLVGSLFLAPAAFAAAPPDVDLDDDGLIGYIGGDLSRIVNSFSAAVVTGVGPVLLLFLLVLSLVRRKR